MGTVTFSEGLSGLARSIQKTVLELIYMKAVVGPLERSSSAALVADYSAARPRLHRRRFPAPPVAA